MYFTATLSDTWCSFNCAPKRFYSSASFHLQVSSFQLLLLLSKCSRTRTLSLPTPPGRHGWVGPFADVHVHADVDVNVFFCNFVCSSSPQIAVTFEAKVVQIFGCCLLKFHQATQWLFFLPGSTILFAKREDYVPRQYICLKQMKTYFLEIKWCGF